MEACTQTILAGWIRHTQSNCQRCIKSAEGYARISSYEPYMDQGIALKQSISVQRLYQNVFDIIYQEQQKDGPRHYGTLHLCRACFAIFVVQVLGSNHVLELIGKFDNNRTIALYRMRTHTYRLVAMATVETSLHAVWEQRSIVGECQGKPGDCFLVIGE